jgi:MoaA/NifB/PqqE/SkfB family radical SAM enzyme
MLDKLLSSFNYIKGKNPLILTYYITGPCNAKCDMCITPFKKHNPKNELKLDEVKSMLIQGKKAGLRVLYILGGEPLIRKDLKQILEFAKKLNYATILNTNGYYLKKHAHYLIKNCHKIIVSIDSPYSIVHDKQRKVNNIFSKAIQGIKELNKEAKKQNKKAKININAVINKFTLTSPHNNFKNVKNAFKTVQGLAELSKNLKTTLTFNVLGTIDSPLSKSLAIKKNQSEKIFKKIYETKRNNYKILNSDIHLLWQSGKKSPKFKCPIASTTIIINEFGDVKSYCNHYGPIKLGNIKTTSLYNIISSKNYKKLMENTWKTTCNSKNAAIVDTSLLKNAIIKPWKILDLIRMMKELSKAL